MATPETSPEIEQESIEQILSDICLDEAKQLFNRMLRLRGKEPMKFGYISSSYRSLETPLFGVQNVPNGKKDLTIGWKAELHGTMPEFIMFAGKKPRDEDFIDFGNSPFLSLNKYAYDENGDFIWRNPVGTIDVRKRAFYDDRIDNERSVLDLEEAAELRVILEYGLQAIERRPRKLGRFIQALKKKQSTSPALTKTEEAYLARALEN